MAEDRFYEERMRKLEDLKSAGVDVYPYDFDKADSTIDILEKYSNVSEEPSQDVVKLAGRVMNLRRMGKASFGHIQDSYGKIQFYIRQEDCPEDYKIFKKIDIGDWIGIEGHVFRTKLGEITVYISKLTFLAKSLHPLPEKFHGLQDTELRFRKRYLDLAVNSEVREVFVKRAKIIDAVRRFLKNKGFLEVEIPVLQPVYGGAEAGPFKTHINAWDMDMYLSISPELYLKRLIVGGFEKIFTICKNFRNEDADKTHNPEFTMMECYWAYHDYNDMMKLFEEMWEYVTKEVEGSLKVEYDGKKFDFKRPWKRMSVAAALKEIADVDIENLDDQQIVDLIEKNSIDYEGELTRGRAILLLFEELVEDKLIHPVIIYDYPREASPLCKAKRGKPDFIEKFEPYVNGWELGNGYSELNDPVLQKEAFEEQIERRKKGEKEVHEMDMDFVEALEYGMPPTGGFGLGIDRMVILLTGVDSLREALLFPVMKPDNEDSRKIRK